MLVSNCKRCSGWINCSVKFSATKEVGCNCKPRISASMTSTGNSSWNIESWACRYSLQRSTMALELSTAITLQSLQVTWRRNAWVTAPSEQPRS